MLSNFALLDTIFTRRLNMRLSLVNTAFVSDFKKWFCFNWLFMQMQKREGQNDSIESGQTEGLTESNKTIPV